MSQKKACTRFLPKQSFAEGLKWMESGRKGCERKKKERCLSSQIYGVNLSSLYDLILPFFCTKNKLTHLSIHFCFYFCHAFFRC